VADLQIRPKGREYGTIKSGVAGLQKLLRLAKKKPLAREKGRTMFTGRGRGRKGYFSISGVSLEGKFVWKGGARGVPERGITRQRGKTY